jgi:hypothetical protein
MKLNFLGSSDIKKLYQTLVFSSLLIVASSLSNTSAAPLGVTECTTSCNGGSCVPGESGYVCVIDGQIVETASGETASGSVDVDVPETNPYDIDGLFTSFRIFDSTAFGDFMSIIYRIILPAAVILGIIQIVLAGYGLMTSEGDPAKTKNAQEQLTSAIMGMLFILLGVGILRALIGTLIEGADIGIEPF